MSVQKVVSCGHDGACKPAPRVTCPRANRAAPRPNLHGWRMPQETFAGQAPILGIDQDECPYPLRFGKSLPRRMHRTRLRGAGRGASATMPCPLLGPADYRRPVPIVRCFDVPHPRPLWGPRRIRPYGPAQHARGYGATWDAATRIFRASAGSPVAEKLVGLANIRGRRVFVSQERAKPRDVHAPISRLRTCRRPSRASGRPRPIRLRLSVVCCLPRWVRPQRRDELLLRQLWPMHGDHERNRRILHPQPLLWLRAQPALSARLLISSEGFAVHRHSDHVGGQWCLKAVAFALVALLLCRSGAAGTPFERPMSDASGVESGRHAPRAHSACRSLTQGPPRSFDRRSPGVPPGPGYCWYYIDRATRSPGFWGLCRGQ